MSPGDLQQILLPWLAATGAVAAVMGAAVVLLRRDGRRRAEAPVERTRTTKT